MRRCRLSDFAFANYVEAGVWCAMGLGFVAAAAVRRAARGRCLAAGIALLAFGVSDMVETGTGAWWRPWWLLAWKAVCVVVLVGMFVAYRRSLRRD